MKNTRYGPEQISLRTLLPIRQVQAFLQVIRNLNGEQITNYGFLPAAVLISLSLFLPLLVNPLRALSGLPGILVYTLTLFALGLFALNRCVSSSLGQTTRAWYGLLAGVFLWYAIQTAHGLGEIQITPVLGMIFVILAVLVVFTLWRPVFPLGVKYAVLVFLMNWAARYLILTQAGLASEFRLFQYTLSFSGFIALVALIFSLLWMVLGAELKIQRMWAAVGVWISAIMILMIFGGLLI